MTISSSSSSLMPIESEVFGTYQNTWTYTLIVYNLCCSSDRHVLIEIFLIYLLERNKKGRVVIFFSLKLSEESTGSLPFRVYITMTQAHTPHSPVKDEREGEMIIIILFDTKWWIKFHKARWMMINDEMMHRHDGIFLFSYVTHGVTPATRSVFKSIILKKKMLAGNVNSLHPPILRIAVYDSCFLISSVVIIVYQFEMAYALLLHFSGLPGSCG